MHRLHPYPDVQVMFRRLLIATLIGLLAATAVALFRHAMVVLETLLLSNDSGSLVNAAQSLPAWRRLVTPALGGLTAGTLLWLWQRRSVARPHAATDYMEATETGDGCFDTPASLVKSLASLLVVVTGSAIGREGAMILLAALAASLLPVASRRRVNGSYGSPAARLPGWPALIMPRWPAACLLLKFSLAR